jgi:hypothetical protein
MNLFEVPGRVLVAALRAIYSGLSDLGKEKPLFEIPTARP